MLNTLMRPMQQAQRRRTRRNAVPTTALRPDIQGLRAFAVLVVILDHLAGWPSGGFVGVDVFFVISGFLITGHLLCEYERKGRISLVKFYARRIKRIFPAATFALAVTVTASYLIFNTSRFRETVFDGIWAALFAANWRFGIQGTDYFEQGGATSPLQHYWSLAVEEQFYFAWPLVLMAVFLVFARWNLISGRTASGIAMAVIVVASFAWALSETTLNPGLAYFSTVSRAWELGAGALLAIFGTGLARIPASVRPFLAWAGLILMTVSLFAINSSSGFPAPAALMPVAGTVLVIAAGSGTSKHRSLGLLTNPVARYIGDISFSLYLWHFPVIIVGSQLIDSGTPSAWVLLTVAYVSLAVFAYHLVEDPIRRSAWLAPATAVKTRPWQSRSYQKTATALLASLAVVVLFVEFHPPKAVEVAAGGASTQSVAQKNQSPEGSEALPPELGKLQEELRAALAATSWPELNPSFEAAIEGGQAPDEIAPCGYKDAAVDLTACTWGDTSGENHAVIVGDSTSMGYVAGLRSAITSQAGWSLSSLGTFGCPFHVPGESLAVECEDRIAGTVATLQQLQPDILFVTNSSGSVEREAKIADLLSEVEASVGKIVYIMPPPAEKVLEDCFSKVSSPADCITRVDSKWLGQARWEQSQAERRGWGFVSSDDWFCVEGFCPAFAGGLVTKKDLNHATPAFQERLGPVIAESLIRSGSLE